MAYVHLVTSLFSWKRVEAKDLQNAVEQDMNSRWFVASKYCHKVVTSESGQVFSMYVTKGRSFTIKVFIEDEIANRQNPEVCQSIEIYEITRDTESATIECMKHIEYVFDNLYQKLYHEFIVEMLEKLGNYTPVYPIVRRHQLPSNWASDVDRYVKRGDVLLLDPQAAHDAAIYMGDGKVIQVSSDVTYKKPASLKKGNLFGDFVKQGSDTLYIMTFFIKASSPDDICRYAETYLQAPVGKHNLYLNHWHFVCRCVWGIRFPVDIDRLCLDLVLDDSFKDQAYWP